MTSKKVALIDSKFLCEILANYGRRRVQVYQEIFRENPVTYSLTFRTFYS